MSPTNRVVFLIGMLSSACLMLSGCTGSAGTATHADTPALIVQIEGFAREAHASNAAARVTVEGMTPATVEAQKPVALVQIDQTEKELGEIATKAPEAKKAAEADGKVIDTQARQLASKHDANAAKILWLAVGLFSLAGAMLGLGIWLNLVTLRNGAFIVGGLALLLLLLSRFVAALDAIPNFVVLLIMFGLLAAAAAVYYFLHRKVSADKASNPATVSRPLPSPLPEPVK